MTELSSEPQQSGKKKLSSTEFLMAIAGQGRSTEHDVSERDEEILAAEVHPIRGWRIKDDDHSTHGKVETK